MKQLNFIVEVVIKDDAETIITRDPRTGQIVDVSSNVDTFSTFLRSCITKIQTKENE